MGNLRNPFKFCVSESLSQSSETFLLVSGRIGNILYIPIEELDFHTNFFKTVSR